MQKIDKIYRYAFTVMVTTMVKVASYYPENNTVHQQPRI